MKTNSSSLPKFSSYGAAIVVLCLLSTFLCVSLFARTPRLRAKRTLASHARVLSSQATSTVTGTATFNRIGFLPGDNSSQIRAVTADGSVAIGSSGTGVAGAQSPRIAVQWTLGGGLVALPQIPYDDTFGGDPNINGSDITASGSWIAYRARPGYPTQLGKREAVICSGDFSQVIPLGRLAPNRPSVANQISDDGSIVFGFARDGDGLEQAFRWTQATGMQPLSLPSDFPPPNSYPDVIPAGRACSPDGSASVGYAFAYDNDTDNEVDVQAYRWTEAAGMQLLGYLPGGNRSGALAVSADGSTVYGVGNSSSAPGTDPWDYSGELFVWTAGSGMTRLGVPAGYDEFGNFAGLSADGALFATGVGDSTNAKPVGFVVIRTATHEAFFSDDLLVGAGLGSAISGWTNWATFGISDNGDTMFGFATNPDGLIEGWVANFPADYFRNVQTFNASNSSTSVAISSGGFVAHDGGYSAANVTIGSASGSTNGSTSARRRSAPTDTVSGASLTLSGTATLSVNGTLTIDSTGALNLLGSSTVTAHALNIASGGVLGAELNAAAETLDRVTISSGPIDLTQLPTANLIVSYSPAAGTAYTIIKNNSGQPIQGHFAGLPENGTILASSRGLRATYQGSASGKDFVVTVLPPPPVVSAVSRMTNSAGTFDLPLALTGPAAVECRSSDSMGEGNYTIVFTFEHNLVNVGSVKVDGDSGSISSSAMGPNQNQYTVNLSDITNDETVTITLTTAIDSENNAGDISVPMSIVIGDSNGDGSVNSADISQVKSQSGTTVTNANSRADLNADGAINSADISLVKSQSGTGLPHY